MKNCKNIAYTDFVNVNIALNLKLPFHFLYLNKTIDQVKGSRCTNYLRPWQSVYLRVICHNFCALPILGIYLFMRCFVCNQINNGYC